jgi:hypothetical protein
MKDFGLPERTPLATVQTVLDVQSRSYDSAVAGKVVGGVRFWGWQIHRLPSHDGDCYLVRADYELELLPYAPEAAAVDVGFRFLTDRAAVLDAIPSRVTSAEGPLTYTLTDQLNFVPGGGAVDLPWPDGAVRPRIPLSGFGAPVEVFGVGGPELRWRHAATATAPVRCGSHTGWFVLAVPRALGVLQVEARTRYHAGPDGDVGVVLRSEPEQFAVRLPAAPSTWDGTSTVRRARQAGEAGSSIRLVFGYDVVGYSDRSVDRQRAVQDRLAALTRRVIAELGVGDGQAETQSAGDSVAVTLPVDIDVAEALPRLLRASTGLLLADNAQHTDRLRLRMAAALGPIRPAALGYDGQTIVECHRLLDCDAVRDLIRRDDRTDLAVIVSDTVHWLFIRPQYPDLNPA